MFSILKEEVVVLVGGGASHPASAIFTNSHNQLANRIRLKHRLFPDEGLTVHEGGNVMNCEILMVFV